MIILNQFIEVPHKLKLNSTVIYLDLLLLADKKKKKKCHVVLINLLGISHTHTHIYMEKAEQGIVLIYMDMQI